MARGEPLLRQWQLIKTLQAHRFGIAADELAARLECAKRTVQRDLNVLQDSGFPISFEQRDFGKKFWKLTPGFIESDKLALSMTEMVSLYLSQQLLSPLSGTQFGDGLASALQKIKALLPEQALGHFADLDGAILVKTHAIHDYSGQDKQIRILNEAILDQRVLRITYHSASQDRRLVTRLHPYGIVLLGATLYCIGWLAEYAEIRTLKVSRIRELERTDDHFDRPRNFSLAAHTCGAFGIFRGRIFDTVSVKFTGWAATNVREQRWHHSQKILNDDGSTVTAEFELSSTVEFKRWILGFGRHATVLEPAQFAEEIAEEMAEAGRNYRESR